MSPFPNELTDKIIDCVEDIRRSGSDPSEGKATLKACSLVCKSWLPRSRGYLLREIKIGPNFGEPKAGEGYVSQEAIDHQIANFAPRARALLETPERSSCLSEDVISSVRKLTISCALPITQIFRTSFFGDLPFTALEEISLRHSDRVQREKAYDPSDPPVSVDSQSFSKLLKKNPKLHSLALHSLDFSGYDQIVEIISSLSQHTHFHTLSLHELHFHGSHLLSESLREKIRSKRVPRRKPWLRTLGVQAFHELYNVLFLLAPRPGPQSLLDLSALAELDVWPQSLQDLRFILDCGPALGRVRLVIIPILSALSSRIRYPVLHFHLLPGKLDSRWIHQGLSSLDSALSVLPSSLIELRLRYYHGEDWPEEWAATDEVVRSWFPKTVGSGLNVVFEKTFAQHTGQKDADSEVHPAQERVTTLPPHTTTIRACCPTLAPSLPPSVSCQRMYVYS
ncbi:hypothetical protein D9758_007694 [Tetrapyrgos nigripes]|uniref:Uncharacterized protein n=1 Tax=Tetrapyrgos nigripes TaxID=182062 RepID=A0A8H5G5H1_9AGAR|nr:hypothetical protein D9758_007694 [Tetrapyrgos nigripes]